MRHATAEDPGSGSDSARALTDQGRREAREAGRALKEKGAAPAVGLTSPRVRARETAELVLAELGRLPIQVHEALTCGATSEVYREALLSRSEPEVLLVAHNPEISAFASSLAGASLGFRPSTICCFDLDDTGARLLWVRHPEAP